MKVNTRTLALLLFLALISLSCEIDTKLRIEGSNPLKVIMSGNGTLSRLVIRGHKTLRKVEGPDSSAVWRIEMTDYDKGQIVSRLSPIIYGQLPKGYIQVYPEQGEAPELEENVTYWIEVETWNANGASGYFLITSGRAKFAQYEYLLKE